MQAAKEVDRRRLEERIAHLRSTLEALEDQLHTDTHEMDASAEIETVRRFPQQSAPSPEARQVVETPLPIAAG